jgi:hypothetical protein
MERMILGAREYWSLPMQRTGIFASIYKKSSKLFWRPSNLFFVRRGICLGQGMQNIVQPMLVN